MSAMWSALVSGGLPYGVLLGLVLGPFRISGVDFGKWYRDPGEIFEGRDRSWIGAMRNAVLFCAKTFWILLGLTIAVSLMWLLWRWTIRQENLALAPAWDIACRYWRPALSFLAGFALAQAALEVAWCLGKYLAAGDGLGYLAKTPTLSARMRSFSVSSPGRPPRRLIICCDGTWNRPADGKDTNVVRLARAIKPEGETRGGTKVTQIIRYHLGVGTGNILDRVVGGGAGIGLSGSVKTCYGFLVDNYQDGDEILLFGFSRGAYVARSIAGLIGRVGLLHRSEMVRFEEVWNYYRLSCKTTEDYTRLDELAPRRVKPEDVDVACIGVWDTVGALGVPGSRLCSSTFTFHETGLGAHVRHAFQALALDECRGNFQPAVWTKTVAGASQVLEQVWFPGVHSNIGGGYEAHGLADASYLWMLSRLKRHDVLDFDPNVVRTALRQYQAEEYARGKAQDSRSLFWKLAFSAVPRPVCLTDPSEKIHDSAFRRICPVYGPGSRRQQWLLALRRPATLFKLERYWRFRFRNAGMAHDPLFPSPEGWCEWLTGKIFGSQ